MPNIKLLLYNVNYTDKQQPARAGGDAEIDGPENGGPNRKGGKCRT